jgi:XTP/dITP diphosphohydrolase
MDTNSQKISSRLSLFVICNYRCGLVVNPESCQTRMQFIVATHNTHKTREMEQILGSGLAIRDLTDHPEISEIAETGTSFEENAKLKSLAVSKKLPGLVIADDSGLEVEALGGAPGIYSARYAGANAGDKQKIAKLLSELAKVDPKSDQRRARFRCVLAVARDGQILATVEGVVEGKIAERPRGSHGFGYDPVFIPDGFEKTFAELPEELKNNISHRAKAIRKLQAKLPNLCGEV